MSYNVEMHNIHEIDGVKVKVFMQFRFILRQNEK